MNKRDYYEVLSVSKNATDEEIKKKYRALAIKYHPDRQNGKSDAEKKEAEEKFKEATEAYEVLSDKDKRAKYDQFGFAGVGDQSNTDYSNVFHEFGDIFGNFFNRGSGFGGFDPFSSFFQRGSNQPTENNDKNIRIQIDLEQALFGCSADIKIRRSRICKTCNGTGSADGKEHTCPICGGSGYKTIRQGFMQMSSTCPQCRGTGKSYATPCKDCNGAGYNTEQKIVTIKIPEGSVTGKTITIPKMGDEGKSGFGDLNIDLIISESSRFKYENGKFLCKVKIGLGNAVLGKSATINLHNKQYTLQIPKGCQNGTQIVLTNFNLPDYKKLYCIVNVGIPNVTSNNLDLSRFVYEKAELETF